MITSNWKWSRKKQYMQHPTEHQLTHTKVIPEVCHPIRRPSKDSPFPVPSDAGDTPFSRPSTAPFSTPPLRNIPYSRTMCTKTTPYKTFITTSEQQPFQDHFALKLPLSKTFITRPSTQKQNNIKLHTMLGSPQILFQCPESAWICVHQSCMLRRCVQVVFCHNTTESICIYLCMYVCL